MLDFRKAILPYHDPDNYYGYPICETGYDNEYNVGGLNGFVVNKSKLKFASVRFEEISSGLYDGVETVKKDDYSIVSTKAGKQSIEIVSYVYKDNKQDYPVWSVFLENDLKVIDSKTKYLSHEKYLKVTSVFEVEVEYNPYLQLYCQIPTRHGSTWYKKDDVLTIPVPGQNYNLPPTPIVLQPRFGQNLVCLLPKQRLQYVVNTTTEPQPTHSVCMVGKRISENKKTCYLYEIKDHGEIVLPHCKTHVLIKQGNVFKPAVTDDVYVKAANIDGIILKSSGHSYFTAEKDHPFDIFYVQQKNNQSIINLNLNKRINGFSVIKTVVGRWLVNDEGERP